MRCGAVQCVRALVCVCVCVWHGQGVGRSVCLSAEHRFILFCNLFPLLASTIHSDLPLGEEFAVVGEGGGRNQGVEVGGGRVVASQHRLRTHQQARGQQTPTQGRVRQRQTERPASSGGATCLSAP